MGSITVYSSQLKSTEMPILIKFIRLPLYFIVPLVFKDKINEYKNEIIALTNDNTTKDLTIQSLQRQAKELREQQRKNKLFIEQIKRIEIDGDYVKTNESRVCEGNMNMLSQILNLGGNYNG